MEINELRINNWVYIPKTDQTVQINVVADILKVVHVNKNLLSSIQIEEVDGIKLNEEWLKRFGFKRSFLDGLDSFPSWQKDKLWIADYLDGTYEFEHTSIEINEVHKLQNLYYCLTDEELKTDAK